MQYNACRKQAEDNHRRVINEVARIEHATLTLHVGAGTFLPVKADDTLDHKMHAEWGRIDAATADRLNAVRARGGRVIAVGTTVVRALETAASGGDIAAFRGETELFILPGYEFRCVDAMITNFHLPRSSLLMLVAAFAGRERILDAYEHAVGQEYRFFSYGDSMFVTPERAA